MAALVEANKAGNPGFAEDFFREEYMLNNLIGNYNLYDTTLLFLFEIPLFELNLICLHTDSFLILIIFYIIAVVGAWDERVRNFPI